MWWRLSHERLVRFRKGNELYFIAGIHECVEIFFLFQGDCTFYVMLSGKKKFFFCLILSGVNRDLSHLKYATYAHFSKNLDILSHSPQRSWGPTLSSHFRGDRHSTHTQMGFFLGVSSFCYCTDQA